MEWSKATVDSAEVRRISRRFRLDVLASTILARRGIGDPRSVLYLLEEDEQYLHNPFALPGMAAAVQRIIDAVTESETIVVFGDRDVDGVTSTALMIDTLQAMGAAASWRLPEGDDPYGITGALIDELAAAGVGLLITVDCGVTACAEIAAARQRGIDVVVVDHHEPSSEVPDALVVDPKLSGSAYPFVDLSACGVVWKLAWALRFARTGLFGETVCLLNARPLQDSIVIEAVRLTNLVPAGKLFETVNPGAGLGSRGASRAVCRRLRDPRVRPGPGAQPGRARLRARRPGTARPGGRGERKCIRAPPGSRCCSFASAASWRATAISR